VLARLNCFANSNLRIPKKQEIILDERRGRTRPQTKQREPENALQLSIENTRSNQQRENTKQQLTKNNLTTFTL
jgi:hypothetical protein